MKYITGIHALNLNNSLDTCGDWHQPCFKWKNLTVKESSKTLFKDYGLEFNKKIPESTKTYTTANHIRACLDLLEDGMFPLAEGMRNDYICNEKYTVEIMEKVFSMQSLHNWDKIDTFMLREYRLDWIKFKKNMETTR